jgi:hypothetical protein
MFFSLQKSTTAAWSVSLTSATVNVSSAAMPAFPGEQ